MMEEDMYVNEKYLALSHLNVRDTRVKESVAAYLMWHSGEVLDENKYPNREDRANKIDALGRESITRFRDSESINYDPRRVLASQSLNTQQTHSNKANPNNIVCHIDVEMIESGAMLPLTDTFKDFKLKYPTELGARGFGEQTYENFRRKYEELGAYLKSDPMTVQLMLEHLQSIFLEKSIVNYSRLADFHALIPFWNIVGAPDGCEATLESSFSYRAGKLVTVTAQVCEVGNTLPMFTKIAFRCISRVPDPETGDDGDRKCNTINIVHQNTQLGIKVKPKECESCKGKTFDTIEHTHKSQAVPVQRIQLQEVNISEEPKSIMVELRGNLTDMVKAGSIVELTGVVRLQPIIKDSLMNHPYILCYSIRVVSEETYTIVVSEEDEEDIKTFVENKSIEERMAELCAAWNGNLLCDPRIKAALMLQAVGAPSGEFGHRTGIHILLAGDPGTAKSLLLQTMNKAVPGSRYIDASAATAAGVTAAAEQIEDFYTGKTRWGLRPGIIALTPKEAVCSLDELNLYKGDLGDLHSALESGFITKTTGPVKGTLRADCSILAGANPMDGEKKKFIAGKGKAFTKQLGMSIPMLQRFDLIFVLLDEADKDLDYDISMSILGFGANRTTSMTIDTVQKYISQCKKHNPKLTEEAAVYISGKHSNKRSSKSGDYMRSHRLVPALQRLSIATARFDLADQVTLEHVKYAETICALSINETDPGLLVGVLNANERKLKADTKRVVKIMMTEKGLQAHNEGIEFKLIKERLKQEGVVYSNVSELNQILREITKIAGNKHYPKGD